MKSQQDLTNHYDKFINKKLEEYKHPLKNKNLLVQSDAFTPSQKKQKFLEGEDNRMIFSDVHTRDKSTSAKRYNQTEVEVWSLDLHSVPEDMSAEDLKMLLRIPNLVSINIDSDIIKNISKGKGKLTFRTNTLNEKESIIEKLNKIGIKLNDNKIVSESENCIDTKNDLHHAEEIGNKEDCSIQNGDEAESKSYNSQLERLKKEVTEKVGQTLFCTQPSTRNNKLNSKIKRIDFNQSKGELFGNTNGSYAKMHIDKLIKDKSAFERSVKDHKTQHKTAQGKLII